MWTRKLRNASTEAVTKAFESILTSSGRRPIEMNVDKGAEFKSAKFRTMLDTGLIKNLRVSEGKNGIATIDRAIQTLKLLITKRTITAGAGNWAQELKTATASYNDTGHTHTWTWKHHAPSKTMTSFSSNSKYRPGRNMMNKTPWQENEIKN